MKTGILALLSIVFFCSAIALAAPRKNDAPVTEQAKKSLELNERGAKAALEKDFTAAERFFREAVAADSGNITAAFNLAGMYLTNKKNQEAIELLNGYIAVAPKEPSLFARLGEAYFGSRDLKKAEKNLLKAFSLKADYPGVSEKLATIYTLEKRLPEAEKMLLKAAELDPKNGATLANLSSILLANGKPQDAVTTAKRALQIKPSSDVYVTMGSAYEALKDFKNSLIAFERAQDLGDSRDEIKTKIEDLKKVVG